MQGKQWSQQPLFSTINLNQFVSNKHKLRKIDRILDLEFVRDLTAHLYCADNGRPSIDPVVFFKMMIIKYMYGIKSDRQLCSDIHHNLAYRWFLGFSIEDKVPDHSSVTRIRDRLGEETFMKVFEQTVAQCQKAGLVQGKQMITDATLIPANAAEKSLEKKNSGGTNDDDPKNFKGKRVSSATHVSKTDPEATAVGRPGYKGLYYKAHVTVDGDSRVITDCPVTTGAKHECTVFCERVDHQITQLGIQPNEWLADSGYGMGPIYEFLRDRKIRSYIPLRDKKLGRGKNGPHRSFRYKRDQDIYECPAGEELEPHSPSGAFTRYRVTDDACQTCELKSECLGTNTRNVKWINRSIYQDEFDKIHARRASARYIKRLKERGWKIEGVFGECKVNHGLRRAHYRSRSKVQIQVYLTSMLINLKRLASNCPGEVFAKLRSLLRFYFEPKLFFVSSGI